MAEVVSKYPEYVTDGFHIYLWHPEYESLFDKGILKTSPAPEAPKVKVLTLKEQNKLEEARKKALQAAEDAVALFKGTAPAATKAETLFGAPPKDT